MSPEMRWLVFTLRRTPMENLRTQTSKEANKTQTAPENPSDRERQKYIMSHQKGESLEKTSLSLMASNSKVVCVVRRLN